MVIIARKYAKWLVCNNIDFIKECLYEFN